jgi:hypothetical protein
VKSPLAITGLDVLTPLDSPDGGAPNSGRAASWESIRAGRRVQRNVAVNDYFLEGEPELDRSIRMALGVARRTLAGRTAGDTHLFCGTSKGPVGICLHVLDLLRQGLPIPPLAARQVALGVGAMGALLGERLNLASGHTSVAACSSGLFALHRAAQALWRGECQRALIVAADASLHPLFEGSFARLGVLAPLDDTGARQCEPFAAHGNGFFLAEAAAALLLEAPDSRPSNAPPLAWLDASWTGGDGSGLIAIDERGESLRRGLCACTPQGPLAFIHAHATGTAHDRFELAAIQAAVPPTTPVFSSKRWLGHSLGAAGLLSAALSLRCHQRGETLDGRPVPAGSSSLTIAQGFGGHIGIVRLRGA